MRLSTKMLHLYLKINASKEVFKGKQCNIDRYMHIFKYNIDNTLIMLDIK